MKFFKARRFHRIFELSPAVKLSAFSPGCLCNLVRNRTSGEISEHCRQSRDNCINFYNSGFFFGGGRLFCLTKPWQPCDEFNSSLKGERQPQEHNNLQHAQHAVGSSDTLQTKIGHLWLLTIVTGNTIGFVGSLARPNAIIV